MPMLFAPGARTGAYRVTCERKCVKCGHLFTSRDCDACKRAYMARKYRENPDQYRRRASEWRKANPERKDAWSKRWRDRNTERVNAVAKARYYRDLEASRDKARRYREDNRDKLRARRKAKYHEDIEDRRAKSRLESNTRKARLVGAGGTLSPDIATRLMVLQKGRCACCSERLVKYHIDHIHALSRGGENIDRNVQLLCPPCNLSKNAKDPIQFMQERGFLI